MYSSRARAMPLPAASQLLLLLLIGMQLLSRGAQAFVDRCDGHKYVFNSSTSHGEVSSPGWPNPYPEKTDCRYKFVASPRQRVRLDFLAFNVEGLGPLCKKDFLDIYVQLDSASTPLKQSPLLGRFCGHSLSSVPRSIVSLGSVLVMHFNSDKNTQHVYNNDMHMQSLGFLANYSFVPADEYEPGSLLLAGNNRRTYLITANDNMEDVLQSPTYPGLYPDNLHFTYIFRAQPGQRIRLEFEEFDTYEISGSSMELRERIVSCPVDVVRFYDSEDRSRPIQGDFCGHRPGLTIVSFGPHLRVEFMSGVGRIARTREAESDTDWGEIHRRGFRARYTISDGMLKLGQSLAAWHIAGTECDFLVKSRGRSSGSFAFPSVRPGSYCRLLFQGIYNRQRAEAVEILLPSNFRVLSDGSSTSRECQSGQLSVFEKGQSLDTTPDRVLCATSEAAEQRAKLRSTGSQLFLRMNAPKGKSSQKFSVEYRFITDFGIPGQPTKEDKCEFIYRSSELQGKLGITNSPLFNLRQKAHYPHNITCVYRFIADKPDQLVRIRFTHFYVEDYFIESLNNDKRHHSTGSYVPCQGDRVELFEGYNEAVGKRITEKLAVYCGTSIPGPYVSQFNANEVVVKFMSTWDRKPHKVYGQRTATGFQIQYDFPPRVDVFSNEACGGNISSDSRGGVIHMPKNPNMKYSPDLICEWHFHPSQPGNRVFVEFPEFHLEGSTKSCSMAVVRIYRGNSHVPASEICGADNAIPAFYSKANEHIRIRLITTAGSRGGKGLKITWTEILRTEAGVCPGFRCSKTGHCIDHRLECNSLPNCGSVVETIVNSTDPTFNRSRSYAEYVWDSSDEKVNCPTETTYQVFHVGIGIGITAALIVLLIVLVLCNRRDKLGKADSLLDISASRHLVSETSDFCVGAGMSSGGASSVPCASVQRRPIEFSESATLTRERMQKISIV